MNQCIIRMCYMVAQADKMELKPTYLRVSKMIGSLDIPANRKFLLYQINTREWLDLFSRLEYNHDLYGWFYPGTCTLALDLLE